jgi:transcription elongation factor GreA
MQDQIITPEGYEKLQAELEDRKTNKRQEIAQRIESAKELGDLSENAEYADAKEEQAFNEGRIAELTSLLKNLTVVASNANGEKINLGSTITVEKDGEKKEFTIVSFNEANPVEGKISNESPLGMAFLGKHKGDAITVSTPKGEVTYKILKIN